ncbi:MAG: carbohydrate-binding family 9-like protein [Mangrovibacterium sp.]
MHIKKLAAILFAASLASCQSTPNKEIEQIKLPNFSPQQYVCYRSDAPLSIDGELDEATWQNAPWTNLFSDIEGDVKPAPLHPTRAKMLWDDEFLYIGAFLEEPHLWGTLTQRDTVIFYDNDFEVFIDPNGDTHGYYEFEMNALNTVWELLLPKPYREGAPPINHWDMSGLKTAVGLKGTLNNPNDIDEGWSVEIAFPLSALHEYCKGVKAKAGNQWRINFSRVQWQLEVVNGKYQKKINPDTGKHFPEYNWIWSPQGIIDMHQPETWGFLQFSDIVSGKGTEPFVFNEDEQVKWELYAIYHAQKNYKSKHNQFSNDLKLLRTMLPIELKYINSVEITNSLFEAIATRPESEFIWHINNEGRTWKTTKNL